MRGRRFISKQKLHHFDCQQQSFNRTIPRAICAMEWNFSVRFVKIYLTWKTIKYFWVCLISVFWKRRPLGPEPKPPPLYPTIESSSPSPKSKHEKEKGISYWKELLLFFLRISTRISFGTFLLYFLRQTAWHMTRNKVILL